MNKFQYKVIKFLKNQINSLELSHYFLKFYIKKYSENKKIKGDRFIISVGDFIKLSIKVFTKKLSVISLSLKNNISSIYVINIIKEENIIVNIINEKKIFN